MLVEILITVSAIVAVFIVFVATRPAAFRISRSLAISASPAFLFEQVDDLRLWEAWSPWLRMDPNVKKSYSGPSRGVGANYSWIGEKTGQGSMTTLESHPNELLRFDLYFFKPFKVHNIAEFTFRPEGTQTVVTWSITGTNNFPAKVFGLLVNFDKMAGSQFENGLRNLKAVAEASTPAQVA